ncbi:hypothetical protein NHX12_008646 [Muraenolepis orangiensis]|uniref:Alpha-2-macroglobulin-like protein 1 n=1 Tax=Muraenolepis orangiensis TaxID=630683 RepID=A0A9Q0I892_9TELE|nr:hypothetical protein NHX12_008646 [Muraenolepis orangiensis]
MVSPYISRRRHLGPSPEEPGRSSEHAVWMWRAEHGSTCPNIYILEYLTNTQQITPKIKARATNFLTSGYQRQLNYKHPHGAYSTFGTGSGNTWLTAFVLRSFVKAKSFIFIDPTVIEDAKSWLESKQQDSGCFQKLGSLFNNRMKGGVSDEVTLSAYVTAALLETNMPASEPQINKSMSCLRQSLGDKRNTYTTALLAYVFTLAGDMETRSLLLEHLDKVATQEGGNLYWSQSSEKSMSLSVEIGSYVLLATLSATPTAADLGYASRIVRWLTSQQNSYGGFTSTQDTVVALQALALYSTLVFSPEGSSTVDVQFPSGKMTFEVNQDNKLLYQERALKDVTGKYSVAVKGTACASMQLSLHYNIPTARDESSFRIEVTPQAECNTNQLRPKLSLRIESRYVGKENCSNMVMVDIKLLSGFVPDPESLRKLKSALLVDRVEHNDDHVIIYLQPFLQHIPVNHSLDILQDIAVENLKPAVVKIYDYYQPSDQAETQYNFCTAACQALMDVGTPFSGEKYADAIVKLQEEFDHRFADFRTHRANFQMFADPFSFDVQDAPPVLQMELIDLQCNSELKAKFREIFDLLPVQRNDRYPYEVNDPDTCLRVRPRRSFLPYPRRQQCLLSIPGSGAEDVHTFDSQISFLSHIPWKRIPLWYSPQGYGVPMAVAMDRRMESPRMVAMAGSSSGPPPILETVRTFFPETWLWDLVDVGKSGLKEVPVIVPDTITTWETEAFCLSEEGFGLAPPKELVVFQPFFLELSLPYSVIRGENLELKATVFNYQSSCIMVSVSPAFSSDYTLTPLAEAQQASCLCAQGRRTHSWKLTPTALGPVNVTMIAEAVSSHTSCDNEIVKVPERGRIDVVTRSLIVKAEGTEQTKTYNVLLCPKVLRNEH